MRAYLESLLRSLTDGWPVKAGLACLASVAGWLFGVWTALFGILLLLMCLDFALGFVRGWLRCRVSSTKIKYGLAKFVFYGLALVVGFQLDATVLAGCGHSLPVSIRDFLASYLILNESISILEHLSFFRVPLPVGLLKRLRVYRDDLCGKEDW